MRLRILLLALLISSSANARPVTYADGWMFMGEHNALSSSAEVMYSPTAKYAVGVSAETTHGENDYETYMVSYNRLLKRWNFPDAQANIFLLTGLGAANADNEWNPAGSVGLEVDAEDRRFYGAYQNEYFDAGEIDNFFMQKARVGIAPYIGGYDDVHTWLMLEVKHTPEEEDNVTITPLVRMFYGNYLGELGVSDKKDIMFNLSINF